MTTQKLLKSLLSFPNLNNQFILLILSWDSQFLCHETRVATPIQLTLNSHDFVSTSKKIKIFNQIF